MAAANAKFPISVYEILRNVSEQNPWIPALVNNLNEQAAETKMVSVLLLSLGTAGRKSLTDKFPHMRIATVSIRENANVSETSKSYIRKR